MTIDLKKFNRELPPFATPILEFLFVQGFTPTLVGGVVRDFFLTGEIGKDWDIELTHDSLSWDLNSWKDLGKSLSKFGKITFLPYDVIRVEVYSHQIELSPPRIETFSEETHHKNFTVAFDYRLPFAEALKRRDFTINSMGLRFLGNKEWQFLDPLNGLLHLREKVLHPSGAQFERDPVRFLRAVRFLLKFELTPSPELQLMLERMSVSGFTPAYLWNEMQKSGNPSKYLSLLLDWQQKHPEMKLPISPEEGHKLKSIDKVLPDPTKHEAWMVALEWVGVSSEKWSEYFSLSLESARRLSRWAQSSQAFRDIKPELFHGEFDEVREKPEFQLLFDWYFTTRQILQKHPQLPLLKMIEEYLLEWIHLYRFEPVKDVKHIEPPLRAKYQVWNLCQRL